MTQVTLKFSFTIVIILYHGSISVGNQKLFRIIEGQSYYWGENCLNNAVIDDIMSDERICSSNYADTMNCKDDEWIIDWDADDLGKARNQKNCLPVPPSQKNDDCSSCLCARVPCEIDCTDIDGYYWGFGESNIDNNEVIVGLDMSTSSMSVNVFTSHAILLSTGKIDSYRTVWPGPLHKYPPFPDCKEFSYNLRTIFLDDVILPVKYVVTGVRMVAIEEIEGHKGWKLQVKGTEYDSSFKLISGTDKWFDYSNDSNSDESYNRNRTEIYLMNDDEYINTAEDITDTNYYVRIRASKLEQTIVHVAIPNIGYKMVTSTDKLPLQGLGLSYRGHPGSVGNLITKVIPHESFILTSTLPAVGTTIGTLIETATVKPEIVQSEVKQHRIHSVNISYDSKSKIESYQKETVDVLDDLFAPVDVGENAGTIFASQLSFIVLFLLFILL